jgi:hypothetical protein
VKVSDDAGCPATQGGTLALYLSFQKEKKSPCQVMLAVVLINSFMNHDPKEVDVFVERVMVGCAENCVFPLNI